jgi:predicted kinase
MPFFLSMRAAIRAKVTAARLDQAEAGKLPDIARVARTYFDWACRFLAPAPPILAAVGGLSGTGKSLLAKMLAPELAPPPGAVVVRTDVERKVLFGKDEAEPLPADAYKPEVTVRVYAMAIDKARRVVAAGHSAVVDGVFAKPAERELVEQAAAMAGVPFTGLFLTADLDTRVRRVGGRSKDASDADATVARTQEDYDLGSLTWPQVDASGTPDDTFRRAKSVFNL